MCCVLFILFYFLLHNAIMKGVILMKNFILFDKLMMCQCHPIALSVYRCKYFVKYVTVLCIWQMESVLMVRMNLNLTQKHTLNLELWNFGTEGMRGQTGQHWGQTERWSPERRYQLLKCILHPLTHSKNICLNKIYNFKEIL